MTDADLLSVVRDFLLKRMPWDLSRPRFIENQREHLREKAQADPMFPVRLREVALETLQSDKPEIIRRGLTALAFVGAEIDLPAIERLKAHRHPAVSRDAGTCLFEIKKYRSGDIRLR
ncbi:MAG TPA: hypothetical protein VJ746_04915 [Nitrospira sp.]|nr:hypothetical protein [Nitrospira sp.]